jgi:hypothetical protein
MMADAQGPGWAGKKVLLCKPGSDDRPQTYGEVWLDALGKVQSTLPEMFRNWEAEGIVGRGSHGRLYPKDGQKFLDELPFMYKSAYLWAEPA